MLLNAMRIVPRMRAWRFSSASPGSVPTNGSASMSRNAVCADSMGIVSVRIPRLAASAAASVTLPSLEKRDGISIPVTCSGPSASAAIVATSDGVDTTRDRDEHVVDAVLLHVVARTEHERLVDLVHRLEHRLDTRRCGPFGDARFAHEHLRERGGSRAPARVEQPSPEARPHVDVDDEQVFTELLRARNEVPALVEQHRCAVEHQLVLPTDEVHVQHRDRRVRGARRQHRLALAQPARVVRGRVDVHDELGPGRGLRDDRAGRAPRVLADRDRDAHAADDEEGAVDGGRREVALLVEDRVVRQQVLAVDAVHATVGAHRGRVEEVAPDLGEPDDRGRAAGAGRDLLEHLGRSARRTTAAGGGPRAGTR